MFLNARNYFYAQILIHYAHIQIYLAEQQFFAINYINYLLQLNLLLCFERTSRSKINKITCFYIKNRWYMKNWLLYSKIMRKKTVILV